MLVFNHVEKIYIIIKFCSQGKSSIKQGLNWIFCHIKPQWEIKHNPKEKVNLLLTQFIFYY